jgi:hypothetical protein
MSTPISEITTVAARWPMPGMLINNSIWAANGASSPVGGSTPIRPGEASGQ